MSKYLSDMKDFEQCVDAGLEECFEQFLLEHLTDIHEYDFSEEFGFFDTEQSFLSKMIWRRLFQEYYKESFGYYYLNYSERFSIYETNEKKEFRIYYDVMNHTDEIKQIYHKIGNYVVYPSMDKKPQLQNIHKYYGERWDKLLLFLKNNWNTCEVEYKTVKNEKIIYKQSESFKDKWCGLSFNEYLILTCQHMYFKDIFLLSQNKDEINRDDVIEWNRLIRQNDYELIEIENPNTMRELINIRGKIIKSILEKKGDNI